MVGTTADFRHFRPPCPLHVNYLPRKNSAAAGRIGEVRLAATVFVQCEFRQENPGGQDANRLVMAEREQVLVAGDDDAGFRGDRSGDHMIVVGVAAGRPISGNGVSSTAPISCSRVHQERTASSLRP